MYNISLIIVHAGIGLVVYIGVRKAISKWKAWHANHLSLHDRVAKLEAAIEAKVKAEAEALVAKI